MIKPGGIGGKIARNIFDDPNLCPFNLDNLLDVVFIVATSHKSVQKRLLRVLLIFYVGKRRAIHFLLVGDKAIAIYLAVRNLNMPKLSAFKKSAGELSASARNPGGFGQLPQTKHRQYTEGRTRSKDQKCVTPSYPIHHLRNQMNA